VEKKAGKKRERTVTKQKPRETHQFRKIVYSPYSPPALYLQKTENGVSLARIKPEQIIQMSWREWDALCEKIRSGEVS